MYLCIAASSMSTPGARDSGPTHGTRNTRVAPNFRASGDAHRNARVTAVRSWLPAMPCARRQHETTARGGPDRPAVLAAEAAARGLRVTGLALMEPPSILDDSRLWEPPKSPG